MDDVPHQPDGPSGWAEALDASLGDLAAGTPTTSADVVHQRIRDTIARMNAKRADTLSGQ